MGSLVLNGATSGSTTLTPTDAVTATLTLPSSSGTILTTANPQSGGVIQVVNATYSTEVTNSTSTLADTGLTATITPKFATSKILIIVNQTGLQKDTSSTAWIILKLLRNSTPIVTFEVQAGNTGTTTTSNFGGSSVNYLDSPATTSATTYKTQYASQQNNARVRCQAGDSTATITLMEIAS